jgi:hypothetical protein
MSIGKSLPSFLLSVLLSLLLLGVLILLGALLLPSPACVASAVRMISGDTLIGAFALTASAS